MYPKHTLYVNLDLKPTVLLFFVLYLRPTDGQLEYSPSPISLIYYISLGCKGLLRKILTKTQLLIPGEMQIQTHMRNCFLFPFFFP